LCATPNEENLLRRSGVAADFVVVTDLDHASSMCASDALVVVMHNHSSLDLARIARESAMWQFPILVRVGVSGTMAAEIMHFAQVCPHAHFSLQGLPPADDVRNLLQPTGFSPLRTRLLTRAPAGIPAQVHPILVAAILAGGKPISISAFARACCMSPRSVEAKLAAAGAPTAQDILRNVLVAHAAWGISRLGLRSAPLAVQLGIASAKILNRRIERATGLTLAKIRATTNVDGFLEITNYNSLR
jgi:hypothetical protein